MLVQKGEEVLDFLQINKMHFFEHIGLELLFVAEVGFVDDGMLADDDTMWGESWGDGLVFVELAAVFVGESERIDA